MATKATVNPPLQARSRRTMDALARAALEIMETQGPQAATVIAIVERAGASVGSFYARFPGKEDLMRYLQERVWAEALETWDSSLASRDWRGLPLAGVVDGVVNLLVSSLRTGFRRRRMVGGAGMGEEESGRRLLVFHNHILRSVAALMLARRQEISHPDPELAVGLGYRMTVGAIRELLEVIEAGGTAEDSSSEFPVDLESARQELARVWHMLLAGTEPALGRSEEGRVDFFDPWGGYSGAS